MSLQLETSPAVDAPWLSVASLTIGHTSARQGTPDLYCKISRDGEPILRVDLYDPPEDYRSVQQTGIWKTFAVIGRGGRLYLVDLAHCAATSIQLDGYFGRFLALETCLLVASGQRLWRIDPDASVRWRSARVGLDGVVVEAVEGSLVRCAGNWDPAESDWRRFDVELETGLSAAWRPDASPQPNVSSEG